MSDIDRVLGALDAHRCPPKKNGRDRWSCRCPAHDDRSASASVRIMADGWITLKCYAGCSRDSILLALGLEWTVLAPHAREFESRRRPDGSMPPRMGKDFEEREVFRLAHAELYVAVQLLQAAELGELPPSWIPKLRKCRAAINKALAHLPPLGTDSFGGAAKSPR